mgnify:CR=1 FL=1
MGCVHRERRIGGQGQHADYGGQAGEAVAEQQTKEGKREGGHEHVQRERKVVDRGNRMTT